MEKKHLEEFPFSDSPYMTDVRKLIRVMRRHHAYVERQIGDLGIRHSQHRMLIQLAKPQASPPSQKDLAEAMGISPAAVTASLKRLEKEGYVSRSMTDEDNRRNEIRITDAGRVKVEESRALFDEIDRATFAGFSEAEMAALADYLRRMKENLTAYNDVCNGEEP